MLTVGIDTYITIEESNIMIASRHRTSRRLEWENTGDVDKAVLLRRACEQLELLPWQGKRERQEQPLSFPRHPSGVPDAVKAAQAEIALQLLNDSEDEGDTRHKMRAQGVKSYSIGDLSETFGDTVKPYALQNRTVEMLLLPYLQGGYLIC